MEKGEKCQRQNWVHAQNFVNHGDCLPKRMEDSRQRTDAENIYVDKMVGVNVDKETDPIHKGEVETSSHSVQQDIMSHVAIQSNKGVGFGGKQEGCPQSTRKNIFGGWGSESYSEKNPEEEGEGCSGGNSEPSYGGT